MLTSSKWHCWSFQGFQLFNILSYPEEKLPKLMKIKHLCHFRGWYIDDLVGKKWQELFNYLFPNFIYFFHIVVPSLLCCPSKEELTHLYCTGNYNMYSSFPTLLSSWSSGLVNYLSDHLSYVIHGAAYFSNGLLNNLFKYYIVYLLPLSVESGYHYWFSNFDSYDSLAVPTNFPRILI